MKKLVTVNSGDIASMGKKLERWITMIEEDTEIRMSMGLISIYLEMKQTYDNSQSREQLH